MSRRKTLEEVNAAAADASAVPQVTANRWQCAANGCPAFAAIAHGERMVCGFHSDVRKERWNGITTKLREFEWLVKSMEAIASHAFTSTNPDWADRFASLCDQNDSPDLAPRETENLGGKKVHERDHPLLLVHRIRAWLNHHAGTSKDADEGRALSHREHFIAIGQMLSVNREQA